MSLTQPVGLLGSTALLAAPNNFAKEAIERSLREAITKALSDRLSQQINLAVTVSEDGAMPPASDRRPPPDRFVPNGGYGVSGGYGGGSLNGGGPNAGGGLNGGCEGHAGGLDYSRDSRYLSVRHKTIEIGRASCRERV